MRYFAAIVEDVIEPGPLRSPAAIATGECSIGVHRSGAAIMFEFIRLCKSICFIFLFCTGLRAAISLKDFNELAVSTDLTDATAMAFAPDGRLFVCQKRGTLRLIKNEVLLADPVLTLNAVQFGERGLIGVAIDPAFPSLPSNRTAPAFTAIVDYFVNIL